MFGNFLYFIVVLLIYSTYQPSGETNFSPAITSILFAALLALFYFFTRHVFRRLERRILRDRLSSLGHLYDTLVLRYSVLAVLLFAVDVYGLNLPSFLADLPVFDRVPTALAILFLCLFIVYLAIVWSCAYPAHRLLFATDLNRRDYVLSNIAFSVPILLPWLVLSGTADLIQALPFEIPRRWLSTPQGEISYFLTFLLLVAVMGPVIIQKFWQCRPLEDGFVRRRIETLCRKAGMTYREILYWPIMGGRMITAGVMGLVKKFRYILVTGGLMRYLEPEEIDAVIAHEIGHVKRHHLLFYLLFFVGYLLLSYATFDLVVFLVLYVSPAYRILEWIGLNPATITSAIFSTVIIVLFLVYFRYVFGYFMRNFERQADIYVYELFDTAAPLISTFHKITSTSGQSPDRPNWHHFSISARIAYLHKCEGDRSWVRRHQKKVNRSISIYLAGLLLVGGIGYHLNYGDAGRKLNRHFFEQIVLRELQQTPDDPALHRLLGDLYYGKKQYGKSARAYRETIRLDPINVEALNNLAWLLATCEEDRIRDYPEALHLARRAADLDPAPHVLDTLAESYFVNGDPEKAVAIERRAMENDWKNRSYYEGQMNKFLNGRNRSGPKQ